ncbi:MAG: type II toxin-antitoxin system VapC family toxin [Thermoanaerobaculia bacterium]
MILVDTSVWIDHFRAEGRAEALTGLLEAEEVVLHPWVMGELALGHLGRARGQILSDVRLLPTVEPVPDDEVLSMIEARRLWGTVLGWVDAGLLAAALAAGVSLWTLDGPLGRAAELCEIRFPADG